MDKRNADLETALYETAGKQGDQLDKSQSDDFQELTDTFLSGDSSILFEKKFSEKLPHYLFEIHERDEESLFHELLNKLGACSLDETVAIREKSLMVLSVLNTLSIPVGAFDISRSLFPILLRWLEKETVYVVGFALICQQLQRIGVEMLRNEHRMEVEELLTLIEKIQNGDLPKNDIIKNMVGMVSNHIISQEVYKSDVGEVETETVREPEQYQTTGNDDPSRNFLTRAVREFSAGNDSLLHSEEFKKHFPHFISELYKNNEEAKGQQYLQRIAECAQSKTVVKREKALVILAVMNNLALTSSNLKLMRDLFALQVDWLEFESVYVVGFASICQQLQRMALDLLRNDYWGDVEPLLEIIYQIENKKIERNEVITKMTGNIREYIASQDILEKIVNLKKDELVNKPAFAQDIVKYFGRSAVLFLLEHLVRNQDKEDCQNIIKLLPGAGDIVPILVDCLKDDPPWYVIKNVLCLIAEINDSKLYYLVEPYLEHEDLRVQQQALMCITHLGGPEMLKRLKDALNIVNDELKGKVVTQLGNYDGEDLADILLDLLFKKKDEHSPQAIKLQVSLCVVLRSFPYPGVVNLLNHYAKQRRDQGLEEDIIHWTLEQTLRILEPKIRHLRCSEDEDVAVVTYDFNPETEQGVKKIVQALFVKAEKIALEGQREQAGEFLFKKVVDAAREKDFEAAEMISEKILAVDPNALPKLIRAGEIIEEEKSTSITKHHLEIWNTLYEDMTTEEFNAFYFSMRSERYETDDIIVKSGEMDPSLYFFNSGEVRMICHCDNQETFLKKIKPGEVAGVGQFFSASVWTVTLIATGFVRLQVLEKEKFYSLIREFPDMESKLRDFCVIYDTVPELVRMSGSDRREFPRYEVSVKVSSMLLDPYGNKGKRTFVGEMIDISCGGLSFYIRLAKKSHVSKLLGRQIICEIKLNKQDTLKCYGMVVRAKVNDILGGDVSVHVKNFRKIDYTKVLEVAALRSG